MLLRPAIRLGALAAFAAAAAALWLAVSPVLPDRWSWHPFASDAPAAGATTTARPAGLPHRIPAWAWQLHAWMLDSRRGPRPKAAPAHVPDWFWAWRKWRLAAERH
jgi:hypothetical protein